MQVRDTLRHYAWVMRQHVGFILLGVTLSSFLTAVISLTLPSVYQASALVKVNGSTASTTNDVFSDQALAVAYALLVTDPEVIQGAAKAMPGMTVDQIKRAISASPLDNTEIIEVRAQANDPQKAADIANAVAHAFVTIQTTEDIARLQNSASQLMQNITQTGLLIDAAQQKLILLQHTHADDASVTRQKSIVDTYQSNYTTALTTYKQFQTQQLQAATMLSIAQLAIPPNKASSPQVALNTLLAACMSLLIMMLLALLLDWMDVTIKTADDVAQLANLEPLGTIPARIAIDYSAHLLDFSVESTDTVREGFAMLGTQFRILNKGYQAILVTGLQTSSGTSTTATHLAISLARSGTRVLLVDANLRRPILHKVFQRTNVHGLVNHLGDVHRFQEQPDKFPLLWLNQWKTTVPNLWVLPTGPSPTHPAAILRMPEIRLLKEWLQGQYTALPQQMPTRLVDIIIFDTATLNEGGDTQALAAAADATVLVIEAGKVSKETLGSVRSLLDRLGVPILGVVVNRQKTNHRSYFYTGLQPSVAKELSPTSTPPMHLVQKEQRAVPETPVPSSLLNTTTTPMQAYKSTNEPLKIRPIKSQFSPLLRTREVDKKVERKA